MADFLAAKITSQGQMMIMQDLNNEIDLQFTRIAYGNGIYNVEEEYASLSSRTALKSQKQAFNINYKMIKGGTSLELGVVANNATLNEGYSMTEVGLFAKDGSDENATEKLYAIAIAKNGCADYMPPYNGSSPVRISQKFQVDVSNASSVTIEFVDGSVVAQSYLEELYYNKAQTDVLLEGKMNIAVLDSISTLSALNEIATDTDYANGNYTLLIPIASGNIISNLDVGIAETAIMTFHGDYVLLYFPYNNKKYRYSDNATYKWVRVYADVDRALTFFPRVLRYDTSTCSSLEGAYDLYETYKDNYDVVYFETSGLATQNGATGRIDCILGQLTFSGSRFTWKKDDTNETFVINPDNNFSNYYTKTEINTRHPKPKHIYLGTSLANATISRNSTVADQLTNKAIGRLYISGTDFVEYVDLESTAGAEVTSQSTPSDNYYIQTWHKCDGTILRRTQIGDSGTPSAWSEIAATTAT